MSTRVVDRVDEWDERSFGGGYAGLHDLADQEFSGVVRADGEELYMTKGVAVGIRHGDIESFEGARGTALRAPSPTLPLLAIMQERSETVRDSFYTEKTPISEADKTLSSGGFTGFIELSENVLSGDYYLVYHGGESMAVAFVGQSERLIDGQEAFETADDEVGIYDVRPVDIDPIELPAGATADTGTATQTESTSQSSGAAERGSTASEGQPTGQESSEAPATATATDATATNGTETTATQTIPSLDPRRTSLPGDQGTESPGPATDRAEELPTDRTDERPTDRSEELPTDVRELQQEYEALRQSYQELREEYQELQSTHEQAERELRQLREELATIQDERE